MAEPAILGIGLAIGAVLLGVLLVLLARRVRRFGAARDGLRADVRTASAQLRALASVRRAGHSHGVDS